MKKPVKQARPLLQTVVERVERVLDKGKVVQLAPGITLDQHITMLGDRGLAWIKLVEALNALEVDPRVARHAPVVEFIQVVRELACGATYSDNAAEAMRPVDTFPPGRKPGAVGKVRKAIQQVLSGMPNATTDEVWSAIKAKPPRGMELYGTTRKGRYIQTKGAKATEYRSFENLVSDERKKNRTAAGGTRQKRRRKDSSDWPFATWIKP